MLNAMKYRGYIARIDFDPVVNVFAGRVLGMRESISFHGASVQELHEDFSFAVDHYLAECGRAGITPERPASGKLLLRLPADVHTGAIVAAAATGKSLNQWLAEVIGRAVE